MNFSIPDDIDHLSNDERHRMLSECASAMVAMSGAFLSQVREEQGVKSEATVDEALGYAVRLLSDAADKISLEFRLGGDDEPN